MPAQAYTFQNMTFCESCALTNSRIGLILAGHGVAKDMDEVIATMLLVQIAAGRDPETPVAVSNDATGTCDNCGKTYEPRTEGSDAA